MLGLPRGARQPVRARQLGARPLSDHHRFVSDRRVCVSPTASRASRLPKAVCTMKTAGGATAQFHAKADHVDEPNLQLLSGRTFAVCTMCGSMKPLRSAPLCCHLIFAAQE